MNTESTTPKKTKKEIYREIIDEANKDLNGLRVEVYIRKKELEGVGGKETYEHGLLKVVEGAGDTGVTLAELHDAFPDNAKLKKAVSFLVKEKKITEEKAKMTTLLKRNPAEQPQQEAPQS